MGYLTRLLPDLVRIQRGPPAIDGLIETHGWGMRWGFDEDPTAPNQPEWQWGLRWDDKAEWAAVTGYVIGDQVRGRAASKYIGGLANQIGFRCTQDHTSAYADEPGYGLNWRQYWDAGDMEIIPELKCAGPQGRCAQDAALADIAQFDLYAPTAASWREIQPSGGWQLPHLGFFDPGPGGYGAAESFWSAQNFVVRYIRYAPIAGEITIPAVCIGLEDSAPGGVPHNWSLRLPGFTDLEKYPTLWYVPSADPDDRQKYAEWQGAGGCAIVSGQQPVEQIVWVEQIGPYLRFAFGADRSGDAWLVKRPDITDGQPRDFYITVGFAGHQGIVLAQPLTYGARCELRPRSYVAVPAGWNPSFNHKMSSSVPGGTALAATTEVDPLNPLGYRPVITATASEPYKRPILWRADTYAAAVMRAGAGAMADVSDIVEATWRRTNEWRGAECGFTLRSDDPTTVPTWKGNDKITLDIALAPRGLPIYWRKFTGYLDAPKVSSADPGEDVQGRVVELTARDGVEARLAKHFMIFSVSSCGWQLGPWWRHTLGRAGVPAALIVVPAALETVVIPDLDMMSKERFRYGHDQAVVGALDDVTKALGLRWGVNANGVYSPYVPVTYSGTPDWTLDEDTVTAADVVYTLESSTSFEDFRNYVLAIVQREHQTTMAIVANFGSHKTDTDPRYIGEDWWAVVLDEDAASATLLAQQALTERQKWANLLVWKTSPKELGPDNFVKVQTDNLNIPTDTIFQIVAESGRWSELEAEVEYVGKVIQYGP